MRLFPAIDLAGGRCVRLEQGQFERVTVYGNDPLETALSFAQAGADALHLVDLDGARDPKTRQFKLIENLANKTPLAVQVGGGIRTADDVSRLLDAGAARVVIGSLAVRDPALSTQLLENFGPERIVFALDVRLDSENQPRLATFGWRETESRTMWDALDFYQPLGLRTVLCTDISRDGMLTGPSLPLYTEFRIRYPQLELLASGGISNLDDLIVLRSLGVQGAITGKALYEGRFTIAEALAC